MAHSMMMHKVRGIAISKTEIDQIGGEKYGVREITITFEDGEQDLCLTLFADHTDGASEIELVDMLSAKY